MKCVPEYLHTNQFVFKMLTRQSETNLAVFRVEMFYYTPTTEIYILLLGITAATVIDAYRSTGS